MKIIQEHLRSEQPRDLISGILVHVSGPQSEAGQLAGQLASRSFFRPSRLVGASSNSSAKPLDAVLDVVDVLGATRSWSQGITLSDLNRTKCH